MSKPTFHPLLTLTVIAAAAIAKERRFIGFDGNVAAAGAKALGLEPAEFAALTTANFDRLFARAAA